MINPDEYPRLKDFLYVLVRDHVTSGVVEGIMWDHVDTEKSSYCNHFTEEYVDDLLQRLLDLDEPITDWKHMYRSPDGKERYYRGTNGERTDAPRELIKLKQIPEEPDGDEG